MTAQGYQIKIDWEAKQKLQASQAEVDRIGTLVAITNKQTMPAAIERPNAKK
jgi:hypothetical protein